MAELRHPYLPLAPHPLHVTDRTIPPEGLGRPHQPVYVGPPLARSWVDDRVEMTRVAAFRAIPYVLPVLHGLHHMAEDIDDSKPQPGNAEDPLQQRKAGHHRRGLDLADCRRRHAGSLGELALTQVGDPADSPHDPGERKAVPCGRGAVDVGGHDENVGSPPVVSSTPVDSRRRLVEEALWITARARRMSFGRFALLPWRKHRIRPSPDVVCSASQQEAAPRG